MKRILYALEDYQDVLVRVGGLILAVLALLSLVIWKGTLAGDIIITLFVSIMAVACLGSLIATICDRVAASRKRKLALRFPPSPGKKSYINS
ncbi:TPA: hypothetical protein DF272_02845 [Candidatus Falkowbacteria bacterium]|nr:hypothetical protein [Candidatus Falkowbacteria bacterium]